MVTLLAALWVMASLYLWLCGSRLGRFLVIPIFAAVFAILGCFLAQPPVTDLALVMIALLSLMLAWIVSAMPSRIDRRGGESARWMPRRGFGRASKPLPWSGRTAG